MQRMTGPGTMLIATAVVAAAAATGCQTSTNLCDAASLHVSQCLGATDFVPGACDEQSASAILELSCEELENAGTDGDRADFWDWWDGLFGDEDGYLGSAQTGDIIFQRSESSQSEAIALATGSDITHVGMVYVNSSGTEYVLEAVGPVRLTSLSSWIDRGRNGDYTVMRLKDRVKDDLVETYGDDVMSDELYRAASRFLGDAYDSSFNWSDSRIYCSELVWKAYERGTGLELGELEELGDLRLSNPIVQRTLEDRYGSDIPYDMQIITPQAIRDSNLLTVVAQEGWL